MELTLAFLVLVSLSIIGRTGLWGRVISSIRCISIVEESLYFQCRVADVDLKQLKAPPCRFGQVLLAFPVTHQGWSCSLLRVLVAWNPSLVQGFCSCAGQSAGMAPNMLVPLQVQVLEPYLQWPLWVALRNIPTAESSLLLYWTKCKIMNYRCRQNVLMNVFPKNLLIKAVVDTVKKKKKKSNESLSALSE